MRTIGSPAPGVGKSSPNVVSISRRKEGAYCSKLILRLVLSQNALKSTIFSMAPVCTDCVQHGCPFLMPCMPTRRGKMRRRSSCKRLRARIRGCGSRSSGSRQASRLHVAPHPMSVSKGRVSFLGRSCLRTRSCRRAGSSPNPNPNRDPHRNSDRNPEANPNPSPRTSSFYRMPFRQKAGQIVFFTFR